MMNALRVRRQHRDDHSLAATFEYPTPQVACTPGMEKRDTNEKMGKMQTEQVLEETKYKESDGYRKDKKLDI